MKKGFADCGVTHARLNHVFFKKVTENDVVIDRNQQATFSGDMGLSGVQGGGEKIMKQRYGAKSMHSPMRFFLG